MTISPDAAAAAFDSLPAAEATEALRTCLHADDWVESMLAGRPYHSSAGLSDRAMAAARSLSDAAVAQALAAHPRIGDRPGGAGTAAAFSRAEQSRVGDDASVAAALREANVAYEERFGRVFLIRAAGRDAMEILGEARRRLHNDEAREAVEVREQLGAIAVLRLRSLLADR